MTDPSTDQLDLEPVVTLEGAVERIVYENPDSGFFVGRLRREGAHELDTFVGNMMAVSPGETVRLRGRWVDDKKFGRQLKVESYETLKPATVDGIEKYLGSGLIQGIGPKYAKRLVDAFGQDTFRVIDEEPKRLEKVEGIGPKRAARIREAWQAQKAVQSIMVFLQGHNITTSQAVKIYKQYGDKAAAVLRENPYRLAQDISGISFATADKIARQLGIDETAPPRLEAGLQHVLWQASTMGHAFLPRTQLLEEAAELLGVAAEALPPALDAAAAEHTVFVEEDRVFLPNLYTAEKGIAERLKVLLGSPAEPVTDRTENALKWVEKHHDITLSEEQREALRRAVQDKVLVITGGPGTGKTTVINSLLAIMQKKGLSYLLAAPTGRAAKRMEEATGREASTIHPLHEFSPKTGNFVRNEANPIAADLIVVDEVSMMDEVLMHCVLKALPPFTRLVLVGDVDQLPSVGAGSVLFDLIASQAVPVVRLETVFRQAAQSGIIANAHRINQGEYPAFNDEDFFLIDRADAHRALETIVEIVTHRIPQKFGLDPRRDIQVLSPMRRGEAGINRLNEALQEALNPGGEALPRRGLRQGDKVMQLRNNYELDVYNGDVGQIDTVDAETLEFEVAFHDDRRVLYSFDDLDELSLAYAATVHKAQGSEYPAVVLAFLTDHYMMLQRNVLYTAITRGKPLVVIVGNPKAVALATRNSRLTRRNTALADRLRNK